MFRSLFVFDLKSKKKLTAQFNWKRMGSFMIRHLSFRQPNGFNLEKIVGIACSFISHLSLSAMPSSMPGYML